MKLPSTRHLERLPSPDPSPEELCADMDEFYVQNDTDQDCRFAQKLAKKRKRLLQWALRRIPADEREAVRLSLMGKTQYEIAAIQRVSQNEVHDRLKLAQRRLVWWTRYGSKLTAKRLQVATDLLLTKEDQRILLAWWRTGSQTGAALEVFGDKSQQKLCQLSLLRSRYIVSKISGLSEISEILESAHENAWIRIDMKAATRGPVLLTWLLATPVNSDELCCNGNNSSDAVGSRCFERRRRQRRMRSAA